MSEVVQFPRRLARLSKREQYEALLPLKSPSTLAAVVKKVGAVRLCADDLVESDDRIEVVYVDGTNEWELRLRATQ